MTLCDHPAVERSYSFYEWIPHTPPHVLHGAFVPECAYLVRPPRVRLSGASLRTVIRRVALPLVDVVAGVVLALLIAMMVAPTIIPAHLSLIAGGAGFAALVFGMYLHWLPEQFHSHEAYDVFDYWFPRAVVGDNPNLAVAFWKFATHEPSDQLWQRWWELMEHAEQVATSAARGDVDHEQLSRDNEMIGKQARALIAKANADANRRMFRR